MTVASQPKFPAPPEDAKTSLRRLTLARWLIDPSNPLTARVIVNRVWQYHFGVGLVRTSSDFGTTGEPPTHPELLDWLAYWFVEHGWSLKALHRLILTSSTYRLSTHGDPRHASLDPENRLLWHLPYRRLEVEVIRDAMLAASGELNRQHVWAEHVSRRSPRRPSPAAATPTRSGRRSTSVTASRRTIYAFVKRSLIVPMLEVLDFCDTARSAARRSVTSVPTQALTLLNGDFVNRQARHLADRLERDAGADPVAPDRAGISTDALPAACDDERVGHARVPRSRESRARLAEAAQAGSPLTAAEAHHRGARPALPAIFSTPTSLFIPIRGRRRTDVYRHARLLTFHSQSDAVRPVAPGVSLGGRGRLCRPGLDRPVVAIGLFLASVHGQASQTADRPRRSSRI